MQIERLILTNYRVYAGRHEFDLSPRKRYGSVRPIILFGGLNGAGKTSILSGVRLALYGRAAYGPRTSQKAYEDFLTESLHRSRNSHRTAQSASAELSFSYAKLGVASTFHVTRSWENKNGKIKEHLRILENGQTIKGLDQEQAQNFLNELIPIGVSDLFFFDGEKISQLADNTGGAVLEQSIKNLLGLDVVERLSGDLTVLNRQLVKSSASTNVEIEIADQQKALDQIRIQLESAQQKIEIKSTQVAEKNSQAKQLKKLLNDRGANFSTSRKDLELELDKLNTELEILRNQSSVLFADALPLALADGFLERTLTQINGDLDAALKQKEQAVVKNAFSKLVKQLTNELSTEDLQKVAVHANLLATKLDNTSNGSQVVHDLTPSQAGSIFSARAQSREQQIQASKIFEEIEHTEKRIDEVIAALARAPDDEIIKGDFENLQRCHRELGALESELTGLKAQAKAIALQALDTAKKLDKLYEDASKSSDQRRVLEYISHSNQLLTEFVSQTASKKIQELEQQFTQCFSRLARKDDLSLNIKIDPETYVVTLMSEDGRRIGKDEISAGEKQIFAISMLEALAKTSGRQLPMIVDTPLGRLDSKHRHKLIENYFPKASHQMVILSTDTEVDESFYKSLSRDISRAYKLDYDSKSGSTNVEEGYFWQSRQTL
jgi:DNA sulfur modification protein DndD